ncbi:MAG: hypothetical protein ACK4VO_01345 [Pseudobdellovibrio sp.]
MNTITDKISNENLDLEKKSEPTVSKSTIIITLLSCLFVAILSSTNSIRNLFASASSDRKIISKIFTEYGDNQFTILKIKTATGIEIEVYEKLVNNHQQSLKQKFELNDDSEAYLMVNSSALNLGLIDINKDGFADIVSPTVDKFGNSRLNVFVYNSDINQFTPSAPDDISN